MLFFTETYIFFIITGSLTENMSLNDLQPSTSKAINVPKVDLSLMSHQDFNLIEMLKNVRNNANVIEKQLGSLIDVKFRNVPDMIWVFLGAVFTAQSLSKDPEGFEFKKVILIINLIITYFCKYVKQSENI